MTWGATPGAWAHWSSTLGLTEDLLPVVSNPHAEVSPDSKLMMIGKVPSDYNFRGQVRGIKGWTQRRSDSRDVERWAQVPDLGICLQTRTVKAIDIDVPDKKKAQRIVKHIEKLLPWHFFPMRSRSDSGKCLLLFKGPLPTKRVIPADGGMIEWLSEGQQCIIEGTHPEGQRYVWAQGRPEAIPEIDADDFETLWDGLCTAFGKGQPTIAREKKLIDREATIAAEDDQAAWLLSNWDVHDVDAEGRLFLRCPFEAEHTTDSGITSTWYAPAGTGGYEQGRWKCLHAHCDGRDPGDFTIACGFGASQFEDLAHSVEINEHGEPMKIAVVSEVLPWPDLKRSKRGIEPTMTNITRVLARPDLIDIGLCYDSFVDQIMWADATSKDFGERAQWRPFRDQHYVTIRLQLEARGFMPMSKEMIKDAVHYTAMSNEKDMAQTWLSRQEWDGVPRVGTFMRDYFGCADTDYARAVGNYAWTAHAGRIIKPGCQADMAMILIGDQGLRKTSLLKAMVPDEQFYVTMRFDEKDADLSRKMRGRLIGELEEMRGINSKQIDEIKAWVTRTREVWIPKFKEHDTDFPRRLVLWGTGNEHELLADTTGERRWLPIDVTDARVEELREVRDQLWAEGAYLYQRDGIAWQEAEALARGEHITFKVRDVWEEPVRRWLNDEGIEGKPNERPFSISEALSGAIGLPISQHNRSQEMRMSKVVKSLGFTRKQFGTEKAWKYVKA